MVAIPVKAGILRGVCWIPAFAGMTVGGSEPFTRDLETISIVWGQSPTVLRQAQDERAQRFDPLTVSPSLHSG